MPELSFYDIIVGFILFFFIVLIGIYIQVINKNEHPEYRFFAWGLSVRLLGAIGFAMIYLYYYGGGDTINYFQSSLALVNLFSKSPDAFFSILAGHLTPENYSYFDNTTGYPLYFRDPWAYSVVRYSVIFIFLGAKSFLGTTLVLAAVSYAFVWRFYRFLVKQYPHYTSELAVAVLFFPSVIFWGSGLLKDNYTFFSSLMLFVASFNIFVIRRKIIVNVVSLIFFSYIILTIKPYIFFIELVVISITLFHYYIVSIRNIFVKFIVFPIVALILIGGSSFVIVQVGTMAGGFYTSLDESLKMASVKQEDLTQSYYNGHSYNIGYFEPTISGVLGKVAPATIAGLYRPFIWEAGNIVMLVSGVETLLLLFLSIYLVLFVVRSFLFKGVSHTIHLLFGDSILVFSVFYVFLFAFVVGLTSSNFGALVRYKIPYFSFFLILLLVQIRRFQEDAKKTSSNDKLI